MLMRLLLLIALALPLPTLAQLRWVEGKHYLTLSSGQTAETRPGKVEVAEVFSYGCIYCYKAVENVAKLKAELPPDAYMTYVHAAFIPSEAWPMYQRAWYTAQAMGIGEANHRKMFAAVWETREVPFQGSDGAIRKPLPSIQEAARFYARAAMVKEADFLKTADSPAVNAQIARADQLIKAWSVSGTPAFVVNGRYMIKSDAVSSWTDIQSLITFLIGQERRRLAQASAAPATQTPAKPAPARPAPTKPASAKP
ncbi:MAG: thiol:disulfide interchange protein DsbA/DsbL [Pseudomonadota bacterium]